MKSNQALWRLLGILWLLELFRKPKWVELQRVAVDKYVKELAKQVMIRVDMVSGIEIIKTLDIDGYFLTRIHLCFANGSYVDVGVEYSVVCLAILGKSPAYRVAA